MTAAQTSLFEAPALATFRDRWDLTRITNDEATDLFVRDHYLHRRGPCSIAFGLTDTQTGGLAGAIGYGTPSSAPLRSGIAGPEHAHNVIELTRLFIADHVPRNAESFLIGNTVRHSGKEIVVSFADPTAGHVGTVYQATNWLYTGLSAKRTDWTVEGVDLHGQTIADRYTVAEIREKYGDRFSLKPRPQKHRYIFLNASKTRKRALRKALRYTVQPYPKETQS